MDHPSPPPPASRLKVTATVLFHSACAISVTLISKSALNGIDAPVTLLALQTFVQVVLITLIGKPMGLIRLNRPLSAWKALLPLTLARLVGILAKTFCLASVNASFYQIARGLLLPFTLLLSVIFLRPTPYFPPISLAGCLLVMCGFGTGMISDYQKMLTSAKGMFLGVGSSFTTAVESVVVKRFVGKGDEGMWQLVWMSNVMACGFYIPLLLVSGEVKYIAGLYTPIINEQGIAVSAADELIPAFLKTALLTGVTSFLLTLATFLQISVTSPTTHMIVTAARGVAQSALAVAVLREKVTAGRIWSMAFILGGSAIYGWAKDRYGRKEGGEQSKGAYTKVSGNDTEKGIDLKERSSS